MSIHADAQGHDRAISIRSSRRVPAYDQNGAKRPVSVRACRNAFDTAAEHVRSRKTRNVVLQPSITTDVWPRMLKKRFIDCFSESAGRRSLAADGVESFARSDKQRSVSQSGC